MKKILYLTRHGQTLFNELHKTQGWCDSPLTKLGIKQALNAREFFENNNISFDHAYSSTSERASDTLELITDLPYKRLKGLKEMNFGTYEATDEDLKPRPFNDYFLQFGGESEEEVSLRLDKTIKDIMNNDDHHNVLIVSHGGAIRLFTRRYDEYFKVDKPLKINNCAILEIVYENDIFYVTNIYNND